MLRNNELVDSLRSFKQFSEELSEGLTALGVQNNQNRGHDGNRVWRLPSGQPIIEDCSC